MAVVENAGISVDSSNRTDNSIDQPKSNQAGIRSSDQNFHAINGGSVSRKVQVNGNGVQDHHRVVANGGRGFELRRNGDSGGSGDEGFKMRELEEMLFKLNPMAEEFVPPSLVNNHRQPVLLDGGHLGYINNFVMQTSSGIANGNIAARRRNSYTNGKRRMNNRTSLAQREEVIRRTVYVSDIDHQVTEEQLAALFVNCGQVVDCRVCGDPNSVLRFAFIEFTDEEGARNALSLAGTMLGYYPVRVLPSKTAIAPVNSTFLPQSEDEREMCARTIYCTNIDKKVTQADVKLFFESICGEVYRLRLLGDYHHSTRIAFVEFVMMGNCVAGAAADKRHKVVRIVKVDGKILELKSPITVNDLLVNFSGFGVFVSETASQSLPPPCELKMGKIYYLRPLPTSTGIISPTSTPSAVETEETGAVKRIKVVITKQQLQELLSKRISVEDVLSGLGVGGRTSSCIDSHSNCWKPKLEPIQEVSE